MKINEDVLDNPVWNALTEVHYNYCIDYGPVKFYQTDYAPFGAFINGVDTSVAIEKHAHLINNFFIVGEKPKMPLNFKAPKRYVGLQMIIYNKINHPIAENILQLNETHYPELIKLVRLVYPEFFKEKTNTLGRYYGIFKNGKLVAVTGERMQTNYFIEISAVVTHPNYVGNGYAKQLITYTANNIFKSGKTPFLHVDETNLSPINLYKKLGFIIRREMQYWKISV
jgi:GNAT superfamily N-acetyltransferase